jgi:hypothetical protein
MSVPNASSRQQSLLLDLISYTQPPVPPAVRVDAFQALRAAVQNYPDMASSFWDIIFRVVAGAIDVSIESSSGVCLNKLDSSLGFVMSVSAPGSGQSSRLADDKLVHSAVKVWNSQLRCK